MNAAHYHLLLSHFPAIAVPVVFIFFLYFQYSKNESGQKFSLVLLSLFSLLIIPAFLTGAPVATLIEDFPSISDVVIEPHEDMAQICLILSCCAAILAMALLILSNQKAKKFLTIAGFVLFASQTAVLIYTAVLGTKIRHTEIRNTNQTFKK